MGVEGFLWFSARGMNHALCTAEWINASQEADIYILYYLY